MKKNIYRFIFWGLFILILFYPKDTVMYTKRALDMCLETLFPSLFPFFVCSELLIRSGACEVMARAAGPVMRPLFNVNPGGAAAFVLGIVSGYPLGAVTACRLYEGMYISKTEAERLLAFCNNSGPLFILGAVGAAMYNSVKAGALMYAAHILGSVSVGMIFKFYKKDTFSAPENRVSVKDGSFSKMYRDSIASAVSTILSVMGTVIFCSALSNIILDRTGISGMAEALIASLFEFVTGLMKISFLDTGLTAKLVMSAWVCAFAGISVHLQVMGTTAESGLSLFPYITGKILHACLAAFYTFLLLRFIPAAEPVSAGFSAWRGTAGACFSSAVFMGVSALSAGGAWLIGNFLIKNRIFSSGRK